MHRVPEGEGQVAAVRRKPNVIGKGTCELDGVNDPLGFEEEDSGQ